MPGVSGANALAAWFASGPGRFLLRFVSSGLVVLLGVVLVDGFILQAEWWQVDHTVTAATQPPLTNIGPPSGPVATGWQLTTAGRAAYMLDAGQLIVASGRGLDVRDARTAAERWHYYRAGWDLRGYAVTGDRLVGSFWHGDRHLMVSLDAVSGEQLWEDRDAVPAGIESGTLRWPAGSGAVLVAGGDLRSVAGFSATGGWKLWSVPLPRGCVLPSGAGGAAYGSAGSAGSAYGWAYGSGGGETLTVLAVSCDAGRSAVVAIDPRSGHVLWTVRERAPRLAVAVARDITVVYDGSAVRGYDRRGRLFLSRTGRGLCRGMCPIAASRGRLFVAYQTDRLDAVDETTGAVVWQRDVPGYAALTIAGGQIYALRPRLAGPLLPAGIDTVDPSTGAAGSAPAPVVLRPFSSSSSLSLGAGGGLLYVTMPLASGTTKMVVLRGGDPGTGPAALGGTPAGDWPDACAMLNDRSLAAAGLPGAPSRPEYAQVEDVSLPSPVGCSYRSAGGGRVPSGRRAVSVSASVNVVWTASDAQGASELFALARQSQAGARPLARIGDGAYGSGSVVTFRSGRFIIAVSTSRGPATAAWLARMIASHLHPSPR